MNIAGTQLLIPYCPSRVLRSSSSSNLSQVPCIDLTFGSRSFRVAVPTIWNFFPDSLRSSGTLHSFRRHFKTHLYQPAFNTPSGILQHLRFTYVTKAPTYLLTYSACSEIQSNDRQHLNCTSMTVTVCLQPTVGAARHRIR